MSLPLEIPMPGQVLGAQRVIASVFYTDEVATVLLLNGRQPYFAVAQVNLEGDDYLLLGPMSFHDNIVHAVREYEQMGGDV